MLIIKKKILNPSKQTLNWSRFKFKEPSMYERVLKSFDMSTIKKCQNKLPHTYTHSFN